MSETNFKSKYIKELSTCRDRGRQLELIVAINKNGLLYEDLSDSIKQFYNLPTIDEGIDVVVLEGSLISEVYQCKNTTKMIIGAHELGTFFNLYLHIIKKHIEDIDTDFFPQKFIVGNLGTKFRDTIDDIIRVDVKEELKKYLPNNINHIRDIIQHEFGGDFGFLHSKTVSDITRQIYQIRVDSWFSGLAKIFRLVVNDEELFNETRSDEFIKEQCLKIFYLKKNFERNPFYEDDFTREHSSKEWLIKLRKVITDLNYMTLTLPNSSKGFLLNVCGSYNTFELLNQTTETEHIFETCVAQNKTPKFKIKYNNLRIYINKDTDTDFKYDFEQSKILTEVRKHYWLFNGWF